MSGNHGENVDLDRLAALLAGWLHQVPIEIKPIDVPCAWPVYKAMFTGGDPVFVKLTTREAAMRTLELLRSCDCPFLPKPLLDCLLDFDGMSVLCLEWKDAMRVNVEDMTDGQLESLVAGCRRLSEMLGRYEGPISPVEEDSQNGQYAALRRYADRHPVMAGLVSPLLDIPETERSYGDRELVIIHGDLQQKNYGFDGDRFAAVYDTDDLTKGLACEDAAYAFTERARRLELSTAKRRRLTELFLRFVELSQWPKDEWLIAVNHSRLRIAAQRLEKHPDSIFVAFDIARRDRPLRLLVGALKGGWAC